jgi:alcohol dehydrogenase
MKALWLESGSLRIRDVPFKASPGECDIRVGMAGICGTDLELLGGYAGFDGIPGHEFVGTVVTAPAGDAQWIGRRVVGDINVGCGSCEWCARGEKEHCPSRTVVGIRGRSGAFAEHLSLPAANLHEVPASISDRAAVFVEPIAAACRILEQVPLSRSSRVAVVGDGRLGLLTAQVLRTATPAITLFGRHAEKLQIARRLDVEVAADDANRHSASFDVVVDATGRSPGLARAFDLVRPRGIVVLKSTFHGNTNTPLWPVAVHEVTIIGSRCGPFDRALALLAAGTVAVEPLIARVLSLEEYAAAFESARHSLKVILDAS